MDTDINGKLFDACCDGNKDLALLIIEKWANCLNLNWALRGACYEDHRDIVLLMLENGADIEQCYIILDEYEIDYLLNKIKNFGKYKHIAELCMGRRILADQILKELNLRDVDTVIYTY